MRNDLFLASERGDLQAIQLLYGQDSRVFSDVTFQGDNALHIAAREGHCDIVNWILQVDSLEPSLADARNNDNNAPLHEAARNRDPDLVKNLFQYNSSCAFYLNKFGETPLIIACKYGHEHTVKQLLEAYNDTTETHQSPTQATYEGGATTHLHAAVQGGCLEIVVAILNHLADDCAWHERLSIEKDNCGRCPIHVAAMKGRWDIISQFMSKGSDCVEIRSSDHKSVLHFAVEYNQFMIVQNLLANKRAEKKAELVGRDHDVSHNTTLHLAAKNAVDPQAQV